MSERVQGGHGRSELCHVTVMGVGNQVQQQGGPKERRGKGPGNRHGRII